MKQTIRVEIECGVGTCGYCRFDSAKTGECKAFPGEHLTPAPLGNRSPMDIEYLRCKSCLSGRMEE